MQCFYFRWSFNKMSLRIIKIHFISKLSYLGAAHIYKVKLKIESCFRFLQNWFYLTSQCVRPFIWFKFYTIPIRYTAANARIWEVLRFNHIRQHYKLSRDNSGMFVILTCVWLLRKTNRIMLKTRTYTFLMGTQSYSNAPTFKTNVY